MIRSKFRFGSQELAFQQALDSNFRLGGILVAGIIAAGILGLLDFVFPYTEDWLPVWTEQGNLLVSAIEKYRTTKGVYPVELHPEMIPKNIPGYRTIRYFTTLDKNGHEFFKITIRIHFREALIYDSRQDPAKYENWGTQKLHAGWVYTRD